MENKVIRVKYIDQEMPHLEHIGGSERSNWVDVRASRLEINGEPAEWIEGDLVQVDDESGEEVGERKSTIAHPYDAGDTVKVYLGFAMELPKGYEAHTAPRSSTFKSYGFLQVNSVGVIDEIYCGDDDEWFITFFATRDGYVEKYDRIGQFRLMAKMEQFEFEPVLVLGNDNRGGYGTSGNI